MTSFLKNNLKNKASSNKKRQQVLSTIDLDDVGIFLRDGPFKSDLGILNLHPSRGTQWFVIKTKIILIN